MLDHRVQDNQEFAHAGRQSHFPGFSRRTKALVKSLDHRVMPGGAQRGHVEGSSYPGPSTPDHQFASEATTVSIQGCHSRQSGDSLAAQGPQLGEVSQEGHGYHWTDSRDTTQKVVFLLPERTLPKGTLQIIIQVSQPPVPTSEYGSEPAAAPTVEPSVAGFSRQ